MRKLMTVALIALVAILAVSTPYVADAARLITGDDIRDNSVASVDVRDGTLRKKDMRPNVIAEPPPRTTRTVHVVDGPFDQDKTWSVGAFKLSGYCRAVPPPNSAHDYLSVKVNPNRGDYQIVSPLDGGVEDRYRTVGPVAFFSDPTAPSSDQADTDIVQLWYPTTEQGLTIIASNHRDESAADGCNMIVTTHSTPLDGP